MEPPMRFELTTYALRVRCSTDWAKVAQHRIIAKIIRNQEILFHKIDRPFPYPYIFRIKRHDTSLLWKFSKKFCTIRISLPWLKTEKWRISLLPEGKVWKISSIKSKKRPISLSEKQDTTLHISENQCILIKCLFRKRKDTVRKRKWKNMRRIQESCDESLIRKCGIFWKKERILIDTVLQCKCRMSSDRRKKRIISLILEKVLDLKSGPDECIS